MPACSLGVIMRWNAARSQRGEWTDDSSSATMPSLLEEQEPKRENVEDRKIRGKSFPVGFCSSINGRCWPGALPRIERKTFPFLLSTICGQSSQLNCRRVHAQQTLKCYQFTEWTAKHGTSTTGSRHWSLLHLRHRCETIVHPLDYGSTVNRDESRSLRVRRELCLCVDE